MIGSFLKRIGVTLSLNDPQWGRGSKNSNQDDKKSPDAPPDLEQIWKDLNQRLKSPTAHREAETAKAHRG